MTSLRPKDSPLETLPPERQVVWVRRRKRKKKKARATSSDGGQWLEELLWLDESAELLVMKVRSATIFSYEVSWRSHNQAAKEVNETNASLNYLKIIKKGWSFVVNIISNPKWINFHLWVISIWLDPVMCYVLSIHDEEKLLKINSELMTVIWILYWTILLYRLLSVGVAMISGETRKVWKDFFFKKMRTFIEKQGDKATRPTTTSDNNARGTGQQPRPTAKAEQQEQSHQATTNRSVSQRKGKVWTILLYKLSLVVVAMSSRETKTVWKVFNVVESMALLLSSVLLNSLVLIPKMEISAPVFSFALVIFLFVYLIRIIGIFRLFTEEVTRISSKSFADSAFVKILLNLQLFFYGGHVERFRRLSDTSLLHLCDCVKPVVYTGRTRIVREGDQFNEMLFVLHGKVCNFSSAASSTNNVPSLDRRKEFLKDGDFWGEELLNWVQDESSSSSSSNKLISQTTIQALTKVEAFVLRIDDLKNLYNEKAKILQSWFRKRRIRISERNTQEKTPPPPGDQLTGPEILKSSPNLVQNPEHVPGQQQPSQPHKDQQHRTNEEHWAGVNDEELPNQVDLSQDDGDDPLWGRNTGGRL
ncbi:hypothetical protein LWI29_009138 [Acer saccharum]|uniref:Cyclic nucleotide-binding domain-containing protein n=1 Tax=Acer saccharum TaxID=4024 RepID=A0AA39SD89_ACESA|nr:hypothetical protein LWI29_009138 [Acer saccharum]